MKICVIGLGYLGATHAIALAQLGHEVVGIDQDENRVNNLGAGRVPFFEPGLDVALTSAIMDKKIVFKSKHDDETAIADVHFICVGTPQLDGELGADTSFLFAAAEELASVIKPDAIVVGKSTVPVGTAAQLRNKMSLIAGFDVKLAWNPEFLREGSALEDSLFPDRIVVGAWDHDTLAKVRKVYSAILERGTPYLELDVPTAELVKVAANSFLATKISFINAMAEVAEVAGADTVDLAEAIGYDERIGKKFLRSGVGFGGGCLPKDIRAFIARAEELGVGSAVDFLRDVDSVNLRRRARVVELAETELGTLAEKKILVLGISFKPDSDDLRDSPALDVAMRLRARGANVRVHDPMALPALLKLGLDLEGIDDVYEAMRDVDLVVLGTEWSDYHNLDPIRAASLVSGQTIIDGRNVLDVAAWQRAGWRLIALGRNVHN